ncbi:MAG: RES domain-containing protein [Bryobacterales bacterium]|nr:RES domain-containing protein [Bryobacterales bacterium]
MAFQLRQDLVVHRVANMNHDFLDGNGASLFGGRWNSRGSRVIYAAEHLSLAMLEFLANAGRFELPVGFGRIEISIPAGASAEKIPAGKYQNTDRFSTASQGDDWLARRLSLVLFVPSVVLGGLENNVLINPLHPEFPSLVPSEPEPVYWDERLFFPRQD